MKGLLLVLCLVLLPGASSADDTIPVEDAPAACHSEPLFHCRAGSGGAPLILVHGWGGSASFWRYQLAHFSRDRTVITVELPGHGRSISYPAEPTIAGLAQALSRLLEELDLNDVVLVGHDMGAFVALATTATQAGKERVVGLVAVESLVDTKVVMPKKQYQRIRNSLQKNFVATAQQMTRDLFSEEADQVLVEWVSNTLIDTDQVMALSLLDDFIGMDLSQALSEFGGRLVIMNSHFNPPNLDKLHQHNPNISSLEVSWQEHFVFIERPEPFNRKLQQALELISDKPR